MIDGEGKLTLKYKPYSPTNHGLIIFNPPVDYVRPSNKELSIVDQETQYNVIPLSVVDNNIMVSADNWKNKIVTVTYFYCDDRIDAILLNDACKYTREVGIN